MRVLVTGGAGFIGSALVDQLVAGDCQVVVVDNLSSGRLANLADALATGRCVVWPGDVTAPDLCEVFARATPEVVFHLAAQIDVRASVADPIFDVTQNVLGTVNVAEAARKSAVRKIVFASSGGSIYGAPEAFPTSESAPVDPRSPYAASKVSGELFLNTYHELYGVQCTHLALSNVYGPRQNPAGGAVAIFSSALLTRRPTTIFGDGGNTRDYVYVADVAAAFVAAAAEVGTPRRYNIGTGIPVSDRELHTLVAAAVGTADTPGFAPMRHGDVRASVLDCTAAQRDLRWRPAVGIVEGVRRTVDYLRTCGAP
ncbi:NAD-dependent epimerase/dehydratase family protein [Nocardia sp. NPDC051756]|uniref:NAD-dependent epimerase/dehydratase family protein n=1 Tax=Nocardia sp. NPDC051756 TaxID=3154751 RepID=UPI00343EB9C6